MLLEVKIPSVGESVREAILSQWYKQDGDRVKKDEPLFVIETDKVTLEVRSPEAGVIKILVAEGRNVAIGTVAATIETAGAAAVQPEVPKVKTPDEPPRPAAESPAPKPEPPQSADAVMVSEPREVKDLSPSVRRLAALHKIDMSRVAGTGPGGRITKGDVLLYLEAMPAPQASPVKAEPQPPVAAPLPQADETIRKPMTPIRRRIASRLLEARQNTAMLTTFNDIDMSRIMDIRSQHKENFKKKHNVNLGFMSFFVKAAVSALKEFPEINAFIDGTDIVYHNYYHIGVAVGSPRGLVVPVIRHADRMSFAGIEQAIVDYVGKIKENRLELTDMEGGTFTITNGGVFGSLLSTPILNTPQSGILGMHRIDNRPVAVNGQVVIRPMMYVALSYDHRIVDGREAVTFLKQIKESIENPERMLMEV